VTDLVPQPKEKRDIRVLQARDEYHEVLELRSTDLRHVREDLDRVPTKRRVLPIVASIAGGACPTSLVGLLAAWAATPEAPYSIRLGFFMGAIFSGFVAVGAFLLDRRDQTLEEVTLETIKTRVDELISMFEQEKKAPRPSSLPVGTSAADSPPVP
jgi:hypothetical protein